MLTLYRLFLYLGLPYFVFKLMLRGLQNKQYFDRIRQRFGFLSIRPKPQGIWVHAVSMGEVNAAAPLITVLMEKYPDEAFTVTTMTPTGSERVERLFGDRVHHCYLPYDLPGAVARFVRRVQPRLGIVMETEIWPNFIHKCHQKKIPDCGTCRHYSPKVHVFSCIIWTEGRESLALRPGWLGFWYVWD